jgi:hypothetical protein
MCRDDILTHSLTALRFCAILSSLVSPSSPDAPCLISSLKDHFIRMTYRKGDTPLTLQPMMEALIKTVMPPDLVSRAIHHDSLHLAIVVVKVKSPFNWLPEWPWLNLVFWILLVVNWLFPAILHCFQEVLIFHTGPHPPPFIADDPKCKKVSFHPITESNIYQVLRATTSLPFYSPQVRFIDGVGPGLFFDGALAHYGMSVDSTSSHPVLLIGDGPDLSVKKNLWDAYCPGRKLSPSFFKHITVVSPNAAFVKQLDAKSLPAVFDYFKNAYVANPELRRRHWSQAYDLSMSQFSSLHQLLEQSPPPSHSSSVESCLHSLQSLVPLISGQSHSNGQRKKMTWKKSKSFSNPFEWIHSRTPSVESL